MKANGRTKRPRSSKKGWLREESSEDEWLLTAVPEEERKACFDYEIARESEKVRRAVAKYRKHFAAAEKQAWEEALEEAKGDPLDAFQIEKSKLSKLVDIPMLERVRKRARGAKRYFAVEEFPDTPWRCLPIKVRAKLAEIATKKPAEPVELVCELDIANPLPLPSAFWSCHQRNLWGIKSLETPTDRLLVFHVRLSGNARQAAECFREKLAELRREHGIASKRVPQGRRGKSGLSAPLDALRALGALRVLSLGLSEADNEPRLLKLGFGERRKEGALESHRNAGASARKAAARCGRDFAHLFGDKEQPLHAA